MFLGYANPLRQAGSMVTEASAALMRGRLRTSTAGLQSLLSLSQQANVLGGIGLRSLHIIPLAVDIRTLQGCLA